MDTMLHFSSDNLATKFLSNEELRSVVPYAYATEPMSTNVSDRYAFIPTSRLIDDMSALGWNVVDAKQAGRRKNAKNHKSFHMLAFQNPNVCIKSENGEVDCYPRIIITNSHDGQNSFKFMIGLFRLVCSNGMGVATETFASISVRHINYTFEELQIVVAKAMAVLPAQVDTMNTMKSINLTDAQKLELALIAIRIRKNNDNLNVDDQTLTDMLTPVREQDAGNDLWTVFNVLQEKIIKGGFDASFDNRKARKVRAIKSASKDIEINQRLYNAAYSYAVAV